MEYNTERFREECAVCGQLTDVQGIDETALCDDHTHRDLRDLKRAMRSDVEKALRERRRR